jgi:hypothetical protein
MRKILFHLLLFFVIIVTMTACSPRDSDRVTIINDPALLSAARTLPQTGTLKVKKNGFVYLHVSHDFKTKLYPLLIKDLNTKDKDCLLPENNNPGPHISLRYSGTLTHQQLAALPIDKQFNFQVVQVGKVIQYKEYYGKTAKNIWYFVRVEAPELQKLIRQVAPDEKKDPPLHISIAVARHRPNGSCYIPRAYENESQ